MSENNTPSQFDLYKIALQTRNFEIELFWKRSNYFLVLNTAIAVGFFNLESNQAIFKIFLCIFGGIVTYLWIRINLGSKYWQSKWEEELEEIEKHITPNRPMFANNKKRNHELVCQNLGPCKRRQPVRGLRNYLVLKKPSVSGTMIVLSLSFIFGWLFLLIFSIACAVY